MRADQISWHSIIVVCFLAKDCLIVISHYTVRIYAEEKKEGLPMNMNYVGIFCIILIAGVYLFCKYSARRTRTGKAIEQKALEASERKEFVVHYRQSKDVDRFAARIAEKCSEYLNSCFKFEEETYSPVYYVLILKDRIEYRSDKILSTSSYLTTYSHSGSISFREENIKDIDRHARMLALGDVLSEKIQQSVLDLVPVGPDGEKGSCFTTCRDSKGNPSVRIPEEVSMRFVFHYTNRTYAEQKREL